MSQVHDQAMQYVYQQVLQRLLEHMSQVQRASLQLLVQRLVVAAGGLAHIGDFTVLLLDGGDRRSAHALACLRAAQLTIANRSQGTFTLRVAVARVGGFGGQALDNCERRFSALFLHDDPRVELLMIEAGQVLAFDARRAQPILEEEREALLLFGHLTGAPPCYLVGSRQQLALADAYCQVLDWNGGANALVCAVPARQRQRYLAWARRCLRSAGQATGQPLQACARTLAQGLSHLHQSLGQQLHMDEAGPAWVRHCDVSAAPLQVIAIDELLNDLKAPARLEEMLGHRDDRPYFVSPLAASLDPLLPAHLQGLYGQYVTRDGYEQGLEAFARQPVAGTGKRRWPAMEQVRCDAMALIARDYGLGEQQLVCMLYAPFIGRGQHLDYFLRRCHPAMLVALPYLHRALQGKACPQTVERWLVTTSGLNLKQLQRLYRHRPDTGHGLLMKLARRDIDLRR